MLIIHRHRTTQYKIGCTVILQGHHPLDPSALVLSVIFLQRASSLLTPRHVATMKKYGDVLVVVRHLSPFSRMIQHHDPALFWWGGVSLCSLLLATPASFPEHGRLSGPCHFHNVEFFLVMVALDELFRCVFFLFFSYKIAKLSVLCFDVTERYKIGSEN